MKWFTFDGPSWTCLLPTHYIAQCGSDLLVLQISLKPLIALPWQPRHNYSVIYYSWMAGWMPLRRHRPQGKWRVWIINRAYFTVEVRIRWNMRFTSTQISIKWPLPNLTQGMIAILSWYVYFFTIWWSQIEPWRIKLSHWILIDCEQKSMANWAPGRSYFTSLKNVQYRDIYGSSQFNSYVTFVISTIHAKSLHEWHQKISKQL